MHAESEADIGEDQPHFTTWNHPDPNDQSALPGAPMPPSEHTCFPTIATTVSIDARLSTPACPNAPSSTRMPISTKNTGTRKIERGTHQILHTVLAQIAEVTIMPFLENQPRRVRTNNGREPNHRRQTGEEGDWRARS